MLVVPQSSMREEPSSFLPKTMQRSGKGGRGRGERKAGGYFATIYSRRFKAEACRADLMMNGPLASRSFRSLLNVCRRLIMNL